MTKIKRKSKSKLVAKISKFFFASSYFPFILSISVIGLLFIMFRMKSIEQDYKFHNLNKKIEQSNNDNKELKAKRAKLLSAKNLRTLAEKHNLTEPGQEQIIVVP